VTGREAIQAFYHPFATARAAAAHRTQVPDVNLPLDWSS
jgi:hypothetical protein